jgi:hypothetical protein
MFSTAFADKVVGVRYCRVVCNANILNAAHVLVVKRLIYHERSGIEESTWKRQTTYSRFDGQIVHPLWKEHEDYMVFRDG